MDTLKFVLKITLILLAVLHTQILWAQNSVNDSESFGYKVTTPGKTVIQIARDVYNDERQWKKIAYWNNLTAPYALSVGQILVLPQKPKLNIAQENLIYGQEVPAPKFLKQLPSVSQVILHRNGYYVYEVNERAPSLSMVALENYGDKSMSKMIARWNGLAATEHLSLSQKLILHEKPTLTTKQANAILIKEWLRVGNSLMAQRLGHPSAAGENKMAHEPAPLNQLAQPIQHTPSVKNIVEKYKALKPVEEKQPVEKIVEKPRKVIEHFETDSSPSLEKNVKTVNPVTQPMTKPIEQPAAPAQPIQANPQVEYTKPKAVEKSVENVEAGKPLPQKLLPTVHSEPNSIGQPMPASVPSSVMEPHEDPELQTHSKVGSPAATQSPEKEKTSPALNPNATAPTSGTPSVSLPIAPLPTPTLPSVSGPSGSESLPELPTGSASTPKPAPVSVTPTTKPDFSQTVQPTQAPPAAQQIHQPAIQPEPVQQNVQQQPAQPVQQAAPQPTAQSPNQTSTTPAPTAQIPPVAPPAAPTVPQWTQEEQQARKPTAVETDPLKLPEPTTDSYWLGSDTFRIMRNLSKDPKK